MEAEMNPQERARLEAESPEADLGPSRASMLAYGLPMLVAGIALIAEGIASWGTVAAIAGFVIGTLGLTFTILALNSKRSR
jgi:hypothetical protein